MLVPPSEVLFYLVWSGIGASESSPVILTPAVIVIGLQKHHKTWVYVLGVGMMPSQTDQKALGMCNV